MQWLFDENNRLHMAGYWYLCNKTIVKICVFVLYMHYTSPATGRLFVVKTARIVIEFLRYLKNLWLRRSYNETDAALLRQPDQVNNVSDQQRNAQINKTQNQPKTIRSNKDKFLRFCLCWYNLNSTVYALNCCNLQITVSNNMLSNDYTK